MHQVLFTPWRYAYITGQSRSETGCFLCAAAHDSADRERLVVRRTDHHVVLLNRHPYNAGHVMIAPVEHIGEPGQASPGALAEFWPLVLEVKAVLAEVYRPDGFNLGMNLGRPAGAGVPDHFHFHLVPRWSGDANFMAVVGETRLVPEDLDSARDRLRERFARRGSA